MRARRWSGAALLALLAMRAAAAAPATVDPVELDKMELMNLRDPFKRPELAIQDGTPKTPLEMVSIDQVKLTGVITGPHRFKAMLQIGDKTYFVSEKAKIGARKGYIAQITQNSIRVRERIVNLLGKEESLDTELKLVTESKTSIPAVEAPRGGGMRPYVQPTGRMSGP